MPPPDAAARVLVLDTNVALDLLVFEDATTTALCEALRQGRLRWLVQPAMREEFVRVLGYPRVAVWRQTHGRSAATALASFDAAACCVEPAPRAGVRCTDADDQIFIDLAVAHGALLLSKDRAVLATRARLAALGVAVQQRFVTKGHLA